jgi:hypothetical protein
LLLFDNVDGCFSSRQERLAQCFGIAAVFFAVDPEAYCGDVIV